MDAFDQLSGPCRVRLLLILKRDRPGLWLAFGLVAGLGLLAKVTMLFFGFAVFVGLLLTPLESNLLGKWPWIGGVVAFAVLIHTSTGRSRTVGPPRVLDELRRQGRSRLDPGVPPRAGDDHASGDVAGRPAGCNYYLLTKGGKPYQALLDLRAPLRDLRVWNAKAYFLAPAYPILFAAGALVVERFIRWREWHWLKPVSVSFLLISGAIVAPLAVVPVLPVEALAKITEPVGGNAGLESEARDAAEIPQPFAFREGWEEMVGTVAEVHEALPEEEREESCVLAGDFGEAGALDLFGPRYGSRRSSADTTATTSGDRDCTGRS